MGEAMTGKGVCGGFEPHHDPWLGMDMERVVNSWNPFVGWGDGMNGRCGEEGVSNVNDGCEDDKCEPPQRE